MILNRINYGDPREPIDEKAAEAAFLAFIAATFDRDSASRLSLDFMMSKGDERARFVPEILSCAIIRFINPKGGGRCAYFNGENAERDLEAFIKAGAPK